MNPTKGGLLISPEHQRATKEPNLTVVWFALHAFAALILSSFVVFVIVGIAKGILGDGPLKLIVERGGFANPLLWGPGFVLGLLVNRIALNRVACWVWPVGVAWLTYGVLDSMHGYDPHFYRGCSALENVVNAFFILNAYRCGGGSSTLEGVFFTMPAVSCAAYALGASVAMRLGHGKSEPMRPASSSK
jgi:hypothetical protein